MNQPRTNIEVDVFNDQTGVIETVTRSFATEGEPTGVVKHGPVSICPITLQSMYVEDMIEYNGKYYSPEGFIEKLESLEKK